MKTLIPFNSSRVFRQKANRDAPTIAIIGCGAITDTFYLPAILKHKNISNNLILVDTNESRLKYMANKYNITHIRASFADLLGRVDGAIIALPHYMHCKTSIDFLRHGAHVLCEKPLAESFMDATAMIDQSIASNVTLSVNNTRRLFPSYIQIHDLIRSGALGTLTSMEYINGYLFKWPTASGFYFNYNDGHPKGVLLDQGAHALDAICWWLGNKPDVIFAQNDSFGGPEGMAVLSLRSGPCTIAVKLSWLSQLQNTFKIVGEHGTIEGHIENWSRFKLTYKNGISKIMRKRCKESTYVGFSDTLVTNFIDVVTKGANPLIPAINIVPSIKLIEECYATTTKLSTPWYDDLGSSC